MRVYRRTMPNGKLSPTFYVEYRVGNRHVIKSTGVATEREALKVGRDLVAPMRQANSARELVEKHRDVLTGAKAVAIIDAWHLFTKKPRRSVSDKQHGSNAARWADFVAFMAAEYPHVASLASITRAHAETYLKHVALHGRYHSAIAFKRGRRAVQFDPGERQLSARTLNVVHNTLRMVFAALAPDTALTENPFVGLARHRIEQQPREAFTIEEVRALVNGADDFLRPLVLAGASTGLRMGDCCTLRWGEVDPADAPGMILRAAHKTGTISRIPLLPGFRAHLAALRPANAAPADYCFPAQAAMYQANACGLSCRMKKLLATIAPDTAATVHIEGRTRAISRRDFHSLRHTFLTLAACANVPPHLLQQLAGHATPSMTARYTAHENDALLKSKLAAMPDPLSLPPGVTIDATVATLTLPAAAPLTTQRAELHRLIDILPAGRLAAMLAAANA